MTSVVPTQNVSQGLMGGDPGWTVLKFSFLSIPPLHSSLKWLVPPLSFSFLPRSSSLLQISFLS
jgi:hypothetical protein